MNVQTDRQTERQTDRPTARTSRLCGARSGSPQLHTMFYYVSVMGLLVAHKSRMSYVQVHTILYIRGILHT